LSIAGKRDVNDGMSDVFTANLVRAGMTKRDERTKYFRVGGRMRDLSVEDVMAGTLRDEMFSSCVEDLA